eukprot:6804353-Karenia_brevis.AAC.1
MHLLGGVGVMWVACHVDPFPHPLYVCQYVSWCLLQEKEESNLVETLKRKTSGMKMRAAAIHLKTSVTKQDEDCDEYDK